MDWLAAILAFGTTMLILAMVVSMLVETVHRIISQRAIGLWKMLDKFYDEVIKDLIESPREGMAPHSGENNAEAIKRDFLAKMTQNKVASPNMDKPGWACWWKGSYINHLPVEMFMERLGTLSHLKLDASDKATLKDLAQKFENYGLNASQRFEQVARSLSIVFAFVLAITFYVHPHDLITTYLEKPSVAQAVAQRAEGLVLDYQDIVSKAEKDQNEGNYESISKNLDDIKQALKETKTEIDALKADGAPLSWPDRDQIEPLDYLWLIVGGFLIGLGAPFWAQAVTSLLKVRDVKSSINEIMGTIQPKAETSLIAMSAQTEDGHVVVPVVEKTGDGDTIATAVFDSSRRSSR